MTPPAAPSSPSLADDPLPSPVDPQPWHPLQVVVQRPVAISMVFVAVSLLGLFAWARLPVELIPAFSGGQLFVNYQRPGSEPAVVEREIVQPLTARLGQLPGVVETSAEMVGSGGTLTVEFERGSDHRVRELELRRLAASLARAQPTGTRLAVSSQDSTALSRFVMSVQVTGAADSNTLRERVEAQVQPRFEALNGVSRVFVFGGASREVTVWVDAERGAALGVSTAQVASAVRKALQSEQGVGQVTRDDQRLSVVMRTRPGGLQSLGEIRLDPGRPVLLRHVARIELAAARPESVSRVNGETAVTLVIFQDEGANLVQLGEALRERLASVREQLRPYGVSLTMSFDASAAVATQLDRLQHLALSGFVVALWVLWLFLRDLRAVAVVAIAVPVSLLAAGALLYLAGYSLNLITLFGLVIGVGMLVDNSIVVYEAVQRQLERGADPAGAAVGGIRRTLRAILTASATNAVVFLPLLYVDALPLTVRQVVGTMVPAILFPLAASLCVAVGLVPLLAQRLAAPAAQARLQRAAQQRRALGGAVAPSWPRELCGGLLKVALRRPAPWVLGIVMVLVLTVVIALPWVLVQSLGQDGEADAVRVEVSLDPGGSLAAAGQVFERLEQAAQALPGVDRVESQYREEQGSVTVHLVAAGERPAGVTAGRVRAAMNAAVAGLHTVELSALRAGGSGEDSGLGAPAAVEIVLSGPMMTTLKGLGEDLKARLAAVPGVERVTVSGRIGAETVAVYPLPGALASHRLYATEALAPLVAVGREGERLPEGFAQADGREIPVRIRRVLPERARVGDALEALPTVTAAGHAALGELANSQREVAAPAISHRQGQRALSVRYHLAAQAPSVGPSRVALEARIDTVVRQQVLPPGYTLSTAGQGASTDWFAVVLIPMVLLLYAVLAMSFESLTQPLLVLVAVPLTVLGGIWALVVAGLGVDMMAVVGAVVLLGLTVNPAILLVDRMQQCRRAGGSGAAAAMRAVRERVRPVLMTVCTSLAGLWPLALVQGQELEIWPPFATVVMGGLVTATLLTLLVIPMGFVLLARLDETLGRLGVWVSVAVLAVTALLLTPLILGGVVVTLSGQLLAGLVIAGGVGWCVLRGYAPRPTVAVDTAAMVVETRYLRKVYGQGGPVVKAWRRCAAFAQAHREQPQALHERTVLMTMVGLGAGLLASQVHTAGWQLLLSYLAGWGLCEGLIHLGRWQGWAWAGRATAPSRTERSLRLLTPWGVLGLWGLDQTVLAGAPSGVSLVLVGIVAGLTLVLQGVWRFPRWRAAAQRLLLWGRSEAPFVALDALHLRAEAGLIGILGPNGAGKTTLLRLLAGILSPSVGTVHYGGVERRRLGAGLASLIGFLPQEFGLPAQLSGREYLRYFSLLHGVGEAAAREQRITALLEAVGLAQKQHQRIGGYSGGMRQRLAVARTLLQEPPVIIVDEPTVGLDPRERIRFRNLLVDLAKGRVVLFSTHVVEDIAVSCERVLVMKRGQLVYDGAPSALAQRAEGRLWQVTVGLEALAELERGYKVIHQVATVDGRVSVRVLSASAPHPQAERVAATLEEGYLQLLYGPSEVRSPPGSNPDPHTKTHSDPDPQAHRDPDSDPDPDTSSQTADIPEVPADA